MRPQSTFATRAAKTEQRDAGTSTDDAPRDPPQRYARLYAILIRIGASVPEGVLAAHRQSMSNNTRPALPAPVDTTSEPNPINLDDDILSGSGSFEVLDELPW